MSKPRRSVPLVRAASAAAIPSPLHDLIGLPDLRNRWWKYWVKDPLEGLAEHSLYRLFRILPLAWCSAIGAWHGRHTGRERHVRTEQARNNLRHIRPDLAAAPDRIEPVLHKLHRNAGRALAEMLCTDRILAAKCIEITRPAIFDTARATGRPLIFVSVHTGNLGDLLGSALLDITGLRGVSTTRPCSNRFRQRLIARLRAGLNATVLPPGMVSARCLLRHLKTPGSTALLHIDEARGKQVHFPAFGRPMPFGGNLTTAIRLAAASNGLLIPVHLTRTGAMQFQLHARGIIDLQGCDDIVLHQRIARDLNTHFEAVVRQHIDDWQQLYYLRMD